MAKRVIHLPSGAKIIKTYVPPPRPKHIHHNHHHHHTRVVKPDNCFPGSAKVMTPTGWKSIEGISAGDLVMSFCTQSSTLVPRAVVKRLDHGESDLWEIRIADVKEPTFTTKSHRFLTARGWIQARFLQAGDEVNIVRGGLACKGLVVSVSFANRSEKVYNLHTTGEHNFIVEGLVVHNFVHFLWIRTVFHRLFVDSASLTESPSLA